MKKLDATVIAAGLLCVSCGLVFSFWPFVPAGIALLVLYGHTGLGVTSGLFFDVLFGAPVGPLSYIHFPFLLFAVLCVGVRVLAVRFLLPSNDLGAL